MTTFSDRPHVLVIPTAAQGHVMPLMKLSYCLVDRGIRITFVNTESIHARLINALPEKGKELVHIDLVSIPDKQSPEEWSDATTINDAKSSNQPAEFEKLIRKINESSKSEQIACVIADETTGWALEIARKMGIRHASFFPAAAGVKALLPHIPKLIELGVIDENGTPKTNETIVLSPSMPGIKAAHFTWYCMQGLAPPQTVFQNFLQNHQISESADWVICNSFDELEHAAIALVPNLLPIGPLLASNQLGNFWPEDLTCLSWLDQQPVNSVIYVAFGSIAILNQRQFDELALGLELLGRPFLWVVRSDIYGRPPTTYPEGYEDRISQLGKRVAWAPQYKVLAHPSVACFVTHCGWNSTIDGVSVGVPFICWPYFADQFFNETYITDIWRIGVGLNQDEDGIISRDEIKKKVDQLLADEVIRGTALKLKEMAMNSIGKGGSSSKNLEQFLEELKR